MCGTKSLGPLGATFLFGAVLLLAIPGCRERHTFVESHGDAVPTFAFAQGSEPRTLDPGFVTDTSAGFIVQNLFEGLLVWNAEGTEVRPGAAERWEVSPDGLVWTFHLRKEAIWSNGDAVTATDFVLSWRRVLNPDGGSNYASLLYPVKGARALHAEEVLDPSLLGVEARDRNTLVVTLEHPTPWFEAIAAHHVLSPVNSRAVKRHGYVWTQPDNIVVNGPFTLAEWTPGERLILTRNPYYHSAASVKLERVEARVVSDPAQVLSMFESGDLQWTGHGSGMLPLDKLRELSVRPDARTSSDLSTAWYTVNADVAEFQDSRVRRALSLALDRSALTEVIGPSGAAAAGFVPPGIPDYVPTSALRFDPEEARALLAAAGFPGGEGFPSIELAVDARNVHEQVGAWVVDAWKRELGIEATVFTRSWPVHLEAMESGGFQVARSGWLGDYPDPATFLDLLHSDNALNRGSWTDSAYDGLIEEASRTEDASSRLRLLAQAEAIVIEESPVIPLFHLGSLTLLKPYVSGYEDNALGVHLLRYISLGTQPEGGISRAPGRG